MSIIDSVYRYPVKGLSPDRLEQIEVRKGEGLAFDRYWAIENGSSDFDPQNLRHIPKGRFLQLAENPKLVRLKCQFDEDKKILTIVNEGEQLVSVDISNAAGIAAIEAGIAKFMDAEVRGPLRLVSAIGHHFSDIPQKAVSLINLASVREISKAAATEISPLRFRGNIYVEGFEPWAEMTWEDRTIAVDGQPMFKVFAETGRCPATQVNLETGERDLPMLDVLSSSFGHTKCGIYMETIDDGLIKPGSKLTII